MINVGKLASIIDSGTCGASANPDSVKSITWELTNDGTLTIKGKGGMADYDYPSDVPWQKYRGLIRNAEIMSEVTSIGNYALYFCTSLASITIPDSVTSIGKLAFYDCRSLASVTIPSSVTSIGDRAFAWCLSLTTVTIPSGVMNISDYAFYGCSSLTSITIPASVTSIGVDTFWRLPNVIIHAPARSYAAKYAKRNHIPFVAE